MLRIRLIRAIAPRLAYHKTSSALTTAEKRGEWLGQGSRALGLAGRAEVATEDLHRVLDGYHPSTGTYLGLRRAANRRAGWDVCLSVGKSVSVAALCGPDSVRVAVRGAYEDAVRTFVPALEALSCRCAGRERPVDTGNLIVAAFTHERSRHDEPHLHTHFLVANATHDRASWRGLEPARFFRNNISLDRAFQRELLRALRARGVTAARFDPKGRVVIPAVSPATCSRLSSAQRTIANAMGAPESSPLRSPDRLHPQAQAALINDRLRPPKKPLEVAQPFDRMLTAAELAALRAMRSAPAGSSPSAPAPPPPRIPLLEVRRRAKAIAPFPTLRAAFAAAVQTAAAHLEWPLATCLEAFEDCRASPRTHAPAPPPTPAKAGALQRKAAAQRKAKAAAQRSIEARLAAARMALLRKVEAAKALAQRSRAHFARLAAQRAQQTVMGHAALVRRAEAARRASQARAAVVQATPPPKPQRPPPKPPPRAGPGR